AVASGITAASGVAFYAMARFAGSLGQWETLIGGSLLVLTAVLNPQGIAGGLRHRAERFRASRVAAS
ncbi:MAG: hypothetical protein ABMA25_01085, partial [Ilumatobacteraceae bacterium]